MSDLPDLTHAQCGHTANAPAARWPNTAKPCALPRPTSERPYDLPTESRGMNQLQLFLPCAAGVEEYLAAEVTRITSLTGRPSRGGA